MQSIDNVQIDLRCIEAVIFDVDGILVNSEPAWDEEIIKHLGELGLRLTPADCAITKGQGVKHVVKFWFDRHPWIGPTTDEVAQSIIEAMILAVKNPLIAMPGARESVAAAKINGWKTGVASSSHIDLVNAAIAELSRTFDFEVVATPNAEIRSKPHPDTYLSALEVLKVDAPRCLAIEDTPTGIKAAKSAGITTIAVPDHHNREAVTQLADLVVDSMVEVASIFSSHASRSGQTL